MKKYLVVYGVNLDSGLYVSSMVVHYPDKDTAYEKVSTELRFRYQNEVAILNIIEL
jgi:hypothetical protein